MNYFSSKQLSEQWGITPRRIVLLASQGRIKGAKQIDGRWFFPEDAIKPQDPRTHNPLPAKGAGSPYIYPYVLVCVNSEEQLSRFTEPERELFRLCELYEAGDFQGARACAEALLSSDNEYIRIGALYMLPFTCMYMEDFKATEKYTILFRTACLSCTGHRTEIGFLLGSFDGEMSSAAEWVKRIDALCIEDFPDELMPFLSICLLFADYNRSNTAETKKDLSAYEVSCRMIEAQGYFYCAMYMHLCLSSYYAVIGNSACERLHMKRAVEIGLAHQTVFTLAYTMSFNRQTTADILSEYPPEIAERFSALTDVYLKARTGYVEYSGKSTVLTRLTEEDYRLISLCLKNYSIEKIAESFGMTRSGINKRLAALYEKLDVGSKQELTQLFINSVMEWESR